MKRERKSMPSPHIVCCSFGVIFVVVAFIGQVNSAKPTHNVENNNAAIKKLVETYNADRNWTRLRAGLEPLLGAGSDEARQLLRIPADEEWPLKKASAVPGYVQLLRLLLDAGLHVDAQAGPHSATMLHWASLRGGRDLVDLLLARGAEVGRRTEGGATPLVLAARNGHADLVKELLSRGADPAAATHDGWTALHCAATRGDLGLARALVDAGAPLSVLARTRWGSSTPLDVARAYEQPLVEEFLAALEAASTTAVSS